MSANAVNNSNNPSYMTAALFPSSSNANATPHRRIVAANKQTTQKNWNERSIDYLNNLELKLDRTIPNNALQMQIDALGNYIEAQFAPLKEFNEWLDSNGHGDWDEQLAIFLLKLPVRAVRNIIRLLYTIIEEITFILVHPLKGLNHLAKLLINLVHELTKPEVWSKIGVGMVGASLGQALVTANPLSVIGLGIGASLTIAGLSVGALKAAITAEEGSKLEAAKQNFFSQVKQLPEAALTGFCMGLIFGGIQRAMTQPYRVSNYEEAKQYADTFTKEHRLPQYSEVELEPSGKINIIWRGPEARIIEHMHPSFFPDSHQPIEFTTGLKMELGAEKAQAIIHRHVWNGFEGYSYSSVKSLRGLGITGRAYPLPAENISFNQYGSSLGAGIAFDSTIRSQGTNS